MITFTNIWKTYPRQLGGKVHTALRNVSFVLDQGKILGLVGANGAGKSTTLRLIMGFLKADSGKITIFGNSPDNHLNRYRIGYLPETASFPSNLSVLDMLRFTGRTNGIKPKQIERSSEKWLSKLGLWEARKRPLRNYSKGMQQRANFVLALLNDPDLFILDEPMSGLDPFGRADIIDLIKTLKQDGKTILFCSHILEDVDRLVDEILVLHKGRNLYQGTVEGLCSGQDAEDLMTAFIRAVKSQEVVVDE